MPRFYLIVCLVFCCVHCDLSSPRIRNELVENANFEAQKDFDPLASYVLLEGEAECLDTKVFTSSPKWFKGNTHAHTVLSNHGDADPWEMVKWYHDHDYNFLVISEHDVLIDPLAVDKPYLVRDDFLLIPGEELTGSFEIYSTAFNITRKISLELGGVSKSAVIQDHLDRTLAVGGLHILAVPNFHEGIDFADINAVDDLRFMEVINGQVDLYWSKENRARSLEALWDDLLSEGRFIYGIASDDSHIFFDEDPLLSNPGRAWIMVRGDELSAEALTDSLSGGRFYSSSGVILKDVIQDDEHLAVVVDESATELEIDNSLFGGRIEKSGPKPDYRIEFIGPDRTIISSLDSCLAASIKLSDEYAYVRARITFSRQTETGWEVFYALTQPVFTDGR